MGIQAVTYYELKCDSCGAGTSDDIRFAYLPSPRTIRENLPGWYHHGGTIACPKCWPSMQPEETKQ